MMIYPPPLRQGHTIGITAPSSGVGAALHPRLDFCLQAVRALGYSVEEGAFVRQAGIVSGPAEQRAAELMRMLTTPHIHAVLPPWGGELLIEILPLLDFDALTSQPKWVIGFSDLSTFLLPYTLRTRIASVHGANLMDTPKRAVGQSLKGWQDVAVLSEGDAFTQHTTSHYEINFTRYDAYPNVTTYNLEEPTRWKCLHHEDDPNYVVTVTGRLIGGCLDCVSMLAGTPFGDVPRFAHDHAPDGLLVYLENCDFGTLAMARALHHLKLVGWFERANAVLLGRSTGKVENEFSNHDAILSALGNLNIPIIYDVDIGHAQPQMIVVNGALATVQFEGRGGSLVQTLS